MKCYRISASFLAFTIVIASFLVPRAAAQNRIALLKWYGANRVANFTVGTNPSCVAFDGENVWVANSGSNTVSKVRAADGLVVGTFTVGTSPQGIAFDGATFGCRM